MPDGANHSIEQDAAQQDKKLVDLIKEPQTRRQLLKGVVGLAAGYGVVSYVNNDLLNRPGIISQAVTAFDNEVVDQHPSITQDVPSPVDKKIEAPMSSDPVIRNIEQRLGVRLVNIFEAYKLLNIPFNGENTKSIGEVIPTRWDRDRAIMLEKFYSLLPKYFHEPDGSGDPLVITLTNFGSIDFAGDFHPKAVHNLIRLDYDPFSPTNERGAFELLTHESTHYLQKLNYSKLEKRLPEILNMPIQQFCEDTITWLDNNPPQKGEDSYFPYMLRYGVQDMLSESNPISPRSTTVEFEAVLAEFYVHGREYFTQNMKNVMHGKEELLYEYMRDEIFGGEEYERFPLDEDVLAEVNKGIYLFNEITSKTLKDSAREHLDIPILKSDDSNLLSKYRQNLFTVNEGTTQFNSGEIAKYISVGYRESDSQTFIWARREIDNNGKIIGYSVMMDLSSDGKRAAEYKRESIIKEGALKILADSIFKLPPVDLKWSTDNNTKYGRTENGECFYNGKYYKISLREFGDLSMTVSSKPD